MATLFYGSCTISVGLRHFSFVNMVPEVGTVDWTCSALAGAVAQHQTTTTGLAKSRLLLVVL